MEKLIEILEDIQPDADIIPENFNSAQALWAMVQRLQAE